LSRDGRFKSICKRLAKRPDKTDELYQEFFLALCEIRDNRLIEAHEGKYLEVFCVGAINNIWNKRFRVKTYANGSTSPLYELNNHTARIINADIDDETGLYYSPDRMGCVPESMIASPEDPEIDISPEAIDHMKELVELAKVSDDPTTRFRARVFDYSRNKYKNTRQFSKASNIPYNVCLESYNIFKEHLKQKLLSCRISL
jgi:hypothetical protein